MLYSFFPPQDTLSFFSVFPLGGGEFSLFPFRAACAKKVLSHFLSFSSGVLDFPFFPFSVKGEGAHRKQPSPPPPLCCFFFFSSPAGVDFLFFV